jgi:hypothetical protein
MLAALTSAVLAAWGCAPAEPAPPPAAVGTGPGRIMPAEPGPGPDPSGAVPAPGTPAVDAVGATAQGLAALLPPPWNLIASGVIGALTLAAAQRVRSRRAAAGSGGGVRS